MHALTFYFHLRRASYAKYKLLTVKLCCEVSREVNNGVLDVLSLWNKGLPTQGEKMAPKARQCPALLIRTPVFASWITII